MMTRQQKLWVVVGKGNQIRGTVYERTHFFLIEEIGDYDTSYSAKAHKTYKPIGMNTHYFAAL